MSEPRDLVEPLQRRARPPGGRRRSRLQVADRLAAVRALVAAGAPRTAILRECAERFGVPPRTVDADLHRLRAEREAPTPVDPERAELLDLARRVASQAPIVKHSAGICTDAYIGAFLRRLADHLHRLGDLAARCCEGTG